MGIKGFKNLLEEIEGSYRDGVGSGRRRRRGRRRPMNERSTIKPKSVPVTVEKSVLSDIVYGWYEMHDHAVRDEDEAYYTLFHDRDARQMIQRMIQFMFEKLNAEYDEDAVY